MKPKPAKNLQREHLLDIVQRVRAVKGVRGAEIFVYLKLRKQTYTWGV